MQIIDYLLIIKPRLILVNLISLIGGFFLSNKGSINYTILINIIIGMFCIIASGCVLNNLIDSDIDSLMLRTKNRILVKKLIKPQNIIIFAIILKIIGLLFLLRIKNYYLILLSIIGFIVYVFFYSFYLKRKYIFSILVGSISGSIIPVIGSCAASKTLNMEAIILFFIFTFWQIPHFYSIAIKNLQDYKRANIPVLPIKKGIFFTKKYIIINIIMFIFMTIILFLYKSISYTYLIIQILISLLWLIIALKMNIDDYLISSKQLLSISIIVITTLSILISIPSFI